jgi:hypothetical protein
VFKEVPQSEAGKGITTVKSGRGNTGTASGRTAFRRAVGRKAPSAARKLRVQQEGLRQVGGTHRVSAITVWIAIDLDVAKDSFWLAPAFMPRSGSPAQPSCERAFARAPQNAPWISMNRKNSARVRASSRKVPTILLVTIETPRL